MDSIVSHMNCLQICLYKICEKHNLADYLMFTNAWELSHDDKKPLSQSLSIPLEDSKNLFLQEFQGLISDIITFDHVNTFPILQLLEKSNIEQVDILIHIDSYECPWHKGFKKLHIPHYVQVINIDFEKEVLICDDPYFNVLKMILPFKNYLSGCKSVRAFRYKPTTNNINSNVIIHHINNRTNIKRITGDISSFAHRLLEVKTHYELFDYMDDIFFCTNVRILKFIADSRYGLSYLFNSLSMLNDKKALLLNIADQFNICGLLFEKINNFYMKLYYRNSNLQVKLQSLYNKLFEVADIENVIYNQLNQLEDKS